MKAALRVLGSAAMVIVLLAAVGWWMTCAVGCVAWDAVRRGARA